MSSSIYRAVNTTLIYIECGGEYLMLHRTKKENDCNRDKWIGIGGKFEEAFCLITCIVNSINCIWVAVAGLLVPDFIYNIGTTVLNGGISMVIFFFVNKIIFPEGEAAK